MLDIERIREWHNRRHAGGHAKKQCEISAMLQEIDVLRAALVGIDNVLGAAGACTANTCEGCRYEMVEASSIARQALGLQPVPELIDVTDQATGQV